MNIKLEEEGKVSILSKKGSHKKFEEKIEIKKEQRTLGKITIEKREGRRSLSKLKEEQRPVKISISKEKDDKRSSSLQSKYNFLKNFFTFSSKFVIKEIIGKSFCLEKNSRRCFGSSPQIVEQNFE